MPRFKNTTQFVLVCALSLFGCTEKAKFTASRVSSIETQSLSTDSFADKGNSGASNAPTGGATDGPPAEVPFSPESKETDVDDADDALIPNLSSEVSSPPKFVVRCDKARFELEKEEVLAAVKNDPTKKTIPVRFAISVGTFIDDVAWYAHRRSILRHDSPMKTPVYVGGANYFAYEGSGAFHYVADHSEARQNFIHGQRCFFDTIKVIGQGKEVLDENGRQNHSYRIMYYGDIYNPNDPEIYNGLESPRLFSKLDSDQYANQPQIIPLYVADFRQAPGKEGEIKFPLLNPQFVSSAVRRNEYIKSFKEIFQLREVWTHRDELTKILSNDRDIMPVTGKRLDSTSSSRGSFHYSGYAGVPQLIDWIVFSGLDATMMSTQYTPIVLDLGERNIKTSSVKWGTFFNLANLLRSDTNNPNEKGKISHLTAWLGGHVVETEEPNAINDIFFKRRADDGFLVLPDANGAITGAANLLGSSTAVQVKGETKTFSNGFDALRALGNKNCASSEIADRYIGPWDGDLYSKKLKVWVDSNRNGAADKGEVLSLEEARVGALNACYRVHKVEEDKFGNSTKLRAAFLLMGKDENISSMQNEIKSRLQSGKTSDKYDADFRVMIDIFFKTRTDFYLENIDPSKVIVPPTI
jgi:hypothetical protein